MKTKLGVVILLLLSANVAFAAPITTSADPLLTGATIITFDEVSLGATDPTIAGVSFGGGSVSLVVQNNGAVSTSPFIGNQTSGTAGTSYDILFSTPVSAFGAMLWAVNSTTMLEAFDSSNSSLGSISLVSTGSAVDGFRGLGGFSSLIAKVTLTTTDYMGLDDLHFVTTAAIPEPSTLALLAIGAAGLFIGARRRNRAA